MRARIALLFSALSLATGAGAEPRFVLVESFGEAGCVECTNARGALQVAERQFAEEQVVWVDYHVTGFLSNGDADARDAYYGHATRPAIWFDGIELRDTSGSPADEFQVTIQTRLAQTSQIAMESAYLFDDAPGMVNIDVTIDAGQTIVNPSECFLRAVVYEDEIDWCCGEDGNDRWDRVVRALLPSVPLTAVSAGEEQSVEHVVPIDPTWNVDRLRVIAFVQRDSSGEILQADRSIDAGGLNPVPEVPPELVRIELDQNVPNPAIGSTRITWTLSGEAHVLLRIFDANGRVVRVLNDGVRPEGRSFLDWNGADFRGQRMAAGVYVIELATPGDRKSRKMVLLR